MGFPANRVQGRVSCCPSIILATEGLIPISGATTSKKEDPASSEQGWRRYYYKQDDYKSCCLNLEFSGTEFKVRMEKNLNMVS